jgi:hypothetical protein
MPFKTKEEQRDYDARRNQTAERKRATTARMKKARETQPDRFKFRDRLGMLWYMYRLRKDVYDAMLKSQDYRCAICKELFTEQPCVDHDHSCCAGKRSCGKCVRGLLCRMCNVGIGSLKENVLIFEAALAYLKGERI